MWTLAGEESAGVDLVGVDIFSPGALDGLVEADEQLSQGFAGTTFQHCQAVVTVAGNSHAPHGIEHSHGDFAVGDQFRNVRQASRVSGIGGAGAGLQATVAIAGDAPATRFQGSNSSMRLMG